jgi:hypothetical protein
MATQKMLGNWQNFKTANEMRVPFPHGGVTSKSVFGFIHCGVGFYHD